MLKWHLQGAINPCSSLSTCFLPVCSLKSFLSYSFIQRLSSAKVLPHTGLTIWSSLEWVLPCLFSSWGQSLVVSHQSHLSICSSAKVLARSRSKNGASVNPSALAEGELPPQRFAELHLILNLSVLLNQLYHIHLEMPCQGNTHTWEWIDTGKSLSPWLSMVMKSHERMSLSCHLEKSMNFFPYSHQPQGLLRAYPGRNISYLCLITSCPPREGSFPHLSETPGSGN